MSILVHSPYSGQRVKVRLEDVGRALRDEKNRIFFVVKQSDQDNYYGSTTRAGSDKDLKRSLHWEQNPPPPPPAPEVVASQAAPEAAAQGRQGTGHQTATALMSEPHDATGQKRPSMASGYRGKLVILVLVIIVATLVYLFGFGPYRWDRIQRGMRLPPRSMPMNLRLPGVFGAVANGLYGSTGSSGEDGRGGGNGLNRTGLGGWASDRDHPGNRILSTIAIFSVPACWHDASQTYGTLKNMRMRLPGDNHAERLRLQTCLS